MIKMKIPFLCPPPTNPTHVADECLLYDAPRRSIATSDGRPQGRCPSGSMLIELTGTDCPGFNSAQTIKITYDIPSGAQLPYHDTPGSPFTGVIRVAYLPNTEDGRSLLTRLKSAWRSGLTFTVGTSMSTGQRNVVTWASIEHKTSLYGGPFGWPDSNYLSYFSRCNGALDAFQVPDAPDASMHCQRIHSTMNCKHAVRKESIFYEAPLSLATSKALSGAIQPPPQSTMAEDCSVCLDPMSVENSVQIQGCKHSFHLKCIEDCLERDVKCPVCRKPVGEPQGRSPSGAMDIKLTQRDCPGYDSTQAIRITYSVPSGRQSSYHENPGNRYSGTTRTAYLPNNIDGRRLLSRLKFAWTHGLTFRIGTSLTTGQSDVVTWASIHHKTSLHGGSHGFPDSNYVSNCNASLDALHVPDADSCV